MSSTTTHCSSNTGRTFRRILPVLALALGFSLFLANPAQAQTEPPCLALTADCTEWQDLESAEQEILLYRSFALDAVNPEITRALLLVHGGNRNAAGSYQTALAAAFLVNGLKDTLIIAPRFASNTGSGCRDTLAEQEANWGCEDRQADSWRNGSTALNNPSITSYDYIDAMLQRLANKANFPNLRHVVIAGHSGGGQFTLRYAMASEVPDTLDLTTSYVVANADALVYFDELRPTSSAYPVTAGPQSYAVVPPAELFRPFNDAGNCTGFNHWPYGLEGRSGYTARFNDEELKQRLASRSVNYMMGSQDILPMYGLDSTCPAMAQGPSRLARGLAFAQYMNDNYGAQHRTSVGQGCGHNERCLFTDLFGLRLLFPN